MAIGTTISLSSLDGNNGFHLGGIEAGDSLGDSVSNARDVNGDDVLYLAGSNLNLDFDGKISGIETICLYGRGDNTLTLTAEDLINLPDTTNTLKVHGNAGDRIVGLSSGWADGGIRPNGDFRTPRETRYCWWDEI